VIVYEVVKEFYLQIIGETVTVGSVIYCSESDTRGWVAIDPPAIPDPLTNFIGGTLIADATCLCEWLEGIDGDIYVDEAGTLPDPAETDFGGLECPLDLMPPGLVDVTSTTFFALKAKTSYVYHGLPATITRVSSKLGTVDTGITQPTTDVTINGTSTLTGAIANSATPDTEVVGTIDTANNTLADGDVIELDVVVGTSGDAANLHVALVITLT